ncbi:carboxypeptidase regulatory-like domain-containing protein [Dyella monticola]|uniref:Carboxypeptidase regulatory-like domain-containing protein n=1 Tax=Dyella monticola TaxID=1927958 RepID=A0A370WYP0_9GAMM|nr:carboxypeptidase-like regulatory domain-containing protein [Dyella monticola]RDS81141.1 carboxypeptidase regulatory-like domain-containing protein [Dyella monticola]
MKTVQKSEVNRYQKHELRFASKLMSVIAVGALGAMAFSAVQAQSTSSSIMGKAPTDGTVTVHSETGLTRHGTPNGKGRYNLSSLPPGTYLVSLEKDGKTLASLQGVPLYAGKAFEVDFACDNDQCSAAPGH